MDALEEQIDLKIKPEENPSSNSRSRSHNPGLRALLSIKNFSTTLLKNYEQLLQIETDLQEVYKNGLLIIDEYDEPGAGETWRLSAAEVDNAVAGLKDTLNAAKEKIEKNEKDDFPGLWQQLVLHVEQLKESAKKSVSSGYKLLPETQFTKWETEFVHVEEPLVQSIVEHVESCRVLLQMIERYTPDELNEITKIIVDKIPLDFTYEEAELYQKDYYKALVNFKKEFKEEKNLWDKFLDILAGGTHQTPSERVMLERWIEGEKGDL